MATPIQAKYVDLTLDGSIVACAQDGAVNVTRDMINFSCLGSSGSKRNIPGDYEYSVSGSGMQIRDSDLASTNTGLLGLLQNMIGSTDTSIAWAAVIPAADVSSQKYLEGYGYLDDMSQEFTSGDLITWSFSIKGDGDIEITSNG